MFFRVDVKLIGQNFVDLGVQYRDGAGFGAGEFFLQRDRIFQFPNLLQKFDNYGYSTRIVNKFDKTFLNIGTADEPVEFMKQGLSHGREGECTMIEAWRDQDQSVDAMREMPVCSHGEQSAE